MANDKELVFMMPERRSLDSVSCMLDNCFSLVQLQQLVRDVRQWFGSAHIVVNTERRPAYAKPIEQILNDDKMCRRKDLVSLLAIILSDSYNLQLYWDHYTDEEKQFFRKALFQHYFALKDLLALQPDAFLKKSEFNHFLVGRYAWFRVEEVYVYQDNKPRVFLHGIAPMEIYRFFMPLAFAGREKSDAYVDDEPLGMGQKHLSFETSIQFDYPLGLSMFTSGKCKRGTTKIITQAVERCFDSMGLMEIFPEMSPERGGRLRSYFLAFAAAQLSAVSPRKRPADTPDAMRFWVDHLDDDGIELFRLLLPQLTGVRANDIRYNSHSRVINEFKSLLRDAGERWVDMSAAMVSILLGLSKKGYSHFLVSYDLSSLSHSVTNVYTTTALTYANSTQQLGIAAIYGYAGALLSMGLVEAVVSGDAHFKATPLERLKRVRLTPLGRYALCMTSHYEAPVDDCNHRYFEVDADRLLFRMLDKNNPYASFMSDVAIPIGNDRYQVTAASLMGPAKDAAGLESRIQMLRQAFGGELSPVWQQFFDSILRRVQPLEQVSQRQFKVFRVSPSNIELQRLLSNDKQLKALALRAEGYYLLVDSANVERFEQRLRELGYLV
jgi:hypothetical protein